jgi:hypothetical protein
LDHPVVAIVVRVTINFVLGIDQSHLHESTHPRFLRWVKARPIVVVLVLSLVLVRWWLLLLLLLLWSLILTLSIGSGSDATTSGSWYWPSSSSSSGPGSCSSPTTSSTSPPTSLVSPVWTMSSGCRLRSIWRSRRNRPLTVAAVPGLVVDKPEDERGLTSDCDGLALMVMLAIIVVCIVVIVVVVYGGVIFIVAILDLEVVYRKENSFALWLILNRPTTAPESKTNVVAITVFKLP